MKSNEPEMSKKYDLVPLLLRRLRQEPLLVSPEQRLLCVNALLWSQATSRRRNVDDWNLVEHGCPIVGGSGYMKSWMNHRNGCEPALSQGGRARSQKFINGADLSQPKCAPWRHPLLSSALPDADVLGPGPPQSSCAVAAWAGCCLPLPGSPGVGTCTADDRSPSSAGESSAGGVDAIAM